ncbi:MAG: type II toxin-antitoxin system Phd/YefM family antitoxin [Gammaproteobacteria bacterium]
MKQQTIGVRDAKAQLSRLLKDVQQGVEWIITDHGTPVARIAPIPGTEHALPDRLDALERRGWIAAAHRNVRKLPAPLPVKNNPAQRWLDEDRNR